MADPIDIQISVGGAEQAARAIGSVTGALQSEGRAATEASSATDAVQNNFGEVVRGGQALISRIQGVAGAVQGLASAFGSHDRTAGLVASIAGTTAQFASMGAMLGPGGALIGGLGGLAAGLLSAADAAREVTHSVEEMNAELARRRRVDASTIGDRAYEHLMELRRANAAEEEARLAREADDVLTGMMAEAEASLASRGGGGGTRDTRWDGAAMTEEALATYTDLTSPEELARRDAADEEYFRNTIERINEEAEAATSLLELKRELAEQEMDIAREKQDYLHGLGEEAARDAEEEAERQAEEREAELNGLMGMVGRASKSIFSAIADVATGAKSGEEAFMGLLKSFLEMISEYASLKAATEFADAASSFARYDYGGGAAHIGAGLAFTAVAVATGVGAAAIGAGPPQAPPRPEAQPDNSGGGGSSTTIINWNSPVVTAGTRAELGRDIRGMLGEAEAA